jgi:hypothetical protein
MRELIDLWRKAARQVREIATPLMRAAILLDLGVQAGVVEKSGSWFIYDGQCIGQGRENATTKLKDDAELSEAIEHAIRANAGLVADAMIAGEA